MGRTSDSREKEVMEKNLGGRPRIEFDEKTWASIEECAKIQCTGEEIAGIIGVDYDTLNARINEKFGYGFSDYIRPFLMNGRKSLRRWQFDAAAAGNVSMLMWLGKQYLGQKEPKEEIDQNTRIIMVDSTDKGGLEDPTVIFSD